MGAVSAPNPRRANMQANRRRDTAPERRLRSLLHRDGLRFRVDYRIGSGRSAPRPDIAFIRARLAVFVDGCFWHCCPQHGARPRANAAYWGPKLERNRARDHENERVLHAMGWEVERVWEHEDPAVAAARIFRLVKQRTAPAAA